MSAMEENLTEKEIKKEERPEEEQKACGGKPLATYVSVDIETTGLKPGTDKIIEIGAVRVAEGEVVDTWQSLVNPGRKLSEHTMELTGMSDELLHDAPDIGEVLPDFLRFVQEDVLLGHSVLFDYSFLKKAAVNNGYFFEKQGIDTLKLSRRFLADLESRNLGRLCAYFGIVHQAHRALGDALATHRLYRILCDRFYEKNVEKEFVPVPLIYKVKKETPASPAQKERLRRLAALYHTELDVDVEKLTRNEASRLADRIPANRPGGALAKKEAFIYNKISE